VQETVGQLAVVGEEQQTLGVEVEAPDRIQLARVGRQEIEDDGPAGRIAPGGDVSARLVEEQVLQRGAPGQRSPVDRDAIVLGIRLRARLEPDGAVDGDASFREQPFSGSP